MVENKRLSEDSRAIVQNAFVVTDIHRAMRAWRSAYDLGPFFLMENVTLESLHRGTPVTLELSIAMAQAGAVNVELIQQLNEVPSCYRDVYPAGGGGFHHVCMIVKDFDNTVARYQERGFELSLEADIGIYRFVYVDTYEALGCHTELVEDAAPIRQLYAQVRDAAEDWDGSDPVRPMYPSN
ncbi:MAG: VOC family protein [Pseudomonadota bacterium]